MLINKLERSVRAQGSDAPKVSTIGGDLTINGNVTSKGEIHIDRHQLKGDVHCVALVVEEDSSVEGVAAEDVVIRGV